MLAYRSTLHESTQCTPNKLMYGWNVALPIDVLAGPSPRASKILGPRASMSCSLCRMVSYFTRELVSTCSGKPKTSGFPSKEVL